jgi:hypothetical protein
MRSLRSTGLAAASLLALAAAPHAAHAAATCSFGTSSEVSLQGVFNDMFGTGTAPNAVSDCLADPADSIWHTDSSVGSATILVELAGNASGNTLGIYDSTSTLNSLEIFSGPAGASSRAFITVSGSAGAYHVQVDRFIGNTFAGSVSSVFASSSFGFYLQQPASAGGERFYSESSRNAGRNGDPNAKDYMYSYIGNGATFASSSIYAPSMVKGTKFDATDALIAWEDLRTASDGDYQDMVVLLRDIVPSTNVPTVPLPAAAWLFASALAGCGVFAQRRRSIREAV